MKNKSFRLRFNTTVFDRRMDTIQYFRIFAPFRPLKSLNTFWVRQSKAFQRFHILPWFILAVPLLSFQCIMFFVFGNVLCLLFSLFVYSLFSVTQAIFFFHSTIFHTYFYSLRSLIRRLTCFSVELRQINCLHDSLQVSSFFQFFFLQSVFLVGFLLYDFFVLSFFCFSEP